MNNHLEKTLINVKGQYRQFSVLVKHFLWRFIYNDIIQFDSQQKVTILMLAGGLAIAGGYISLKIFSPCTAASFAAENTWLPKTYFFCLMMAFTGIVFAVTWDKIFLEKDDIQNLLPLPVKLSTIISAKLTAVFVFVGLIAVIFGLLSTFISTFYLAGKLSVNPIYFALMYFLSLFTANLFVFLFLALLQALLMTIFKNRLLIKVSIFLQTILIGGFISVFVWFPVFYDALPELKASFAQAVYWFPPLWFVGMNEVIIGSRDVIFNAHLYIAFIATAAPLILYSFHFYTGCRNILNDNPLEKKNLELSKPAGFFTGKLNAFFLKHPLERAIFYFTLNTLRRNRQYKIHLVVFMVLPLGFLVTRLLYLYYDNLELLLYTIDGNTLSVPLALGFFLAAGLRNIVLYPETLEANWMFKVTETTAGKYYYTSGLRKALIIFGPVPLFTVVFLLHLFFWGFERAFYHSLYGFFVTMLVLELFFFTYKKVPFACASVSGKINIKAWWPFYLAVFFVYLYGFTSLEVVLMDLPAGFIAFYALVYGVIVLLRYYRKGSKSHFHFVYEDAPEEAMTTLDNYLG